MKKRSVQKRGKSVLVGDGAVTLHSVLAYVLLAYVDEECVAEIAYTCDRWVAKSDGLHKPGFVEPMREFVHWLMCNDRVRELVIDRKREDYQQ